MQTKRQFKTMPLHKEEELRSQAPEPKFLVDDKGHLLHRKQSSSTERTTSIERARTCGNHGFTFTPVGYNDYTVKSNSILKGVRPELGHTNPVAHHFLPKHQNEQQLQNTYLVTRPEQSQKFN